MIFLEVRPQGFFLFSFLAKTHWEFPVQPTRPRPPSVRWGVSFERVLWLWFFFSACFCQARFSSVFRLVRPRRPPFFVEFLGLDAPGSQVQPSPPLTHPPPPPPPRNTSSRRRILSPLPRFPQPLPSCFLGTEQLFRCNTNLLLSALSGLSFLRGA